MTGISLCIFLLAALACLSLSFVPLPVESKKGQKYRCPSGYNMSGMNCMTRVYEEPKLVCTDGYLEGDQCVKYVAAKPSCPPGYNLSKSLHSTKMRKLKKITHSHPIPPQCVRVQSSSPVPFCPPSYVLSGDRCVRTDTRPLICPSGTSDVGQHCVAHSPALKECPAEFFQVLASNTKNYKLNKHEDCFKANTVDSFPVCKAGYDLVADGVCSKISMISPVCRKGYEDLGDICAKYSRAKRVCDDGFYLTSKNTCERKIDIHAQEYCDNGYSLVNGSCIKTVLVSPVCPRGTKDIGDKCATYKPSTVVCPKGFSLTTRQGEKVCVKHLYADRFPICNDSDSTLNTQSQCVKTLFHEAVCPPGSTQSGEGCVAYKPAMSQCPEGYKRQHKHKKFDLIGHSDTCVQVVNVDSTPVCSEGYNLVGDKCEQICSVPATAMCTKGARHFDECVEYSLCKPQYTCTKGFKYIGNRRCAREITQDCQKVDYETRCYDVPECFEDDCSETYDRFHKRRLGAVDCDGGQCEKSENKRSLHRLLAPKYTVAHYVDCDSADDDCIRSKMPHSHSKNGQLCETVAIEKADMCSDTVEADAIMVCPDGSLTAEGQCRVAQYSSLSFVCSEGILDSAHNCISKKYERPSYVCPMGFKLIRKGSTKGSCVAVNTAKLDYFCTEGGEFVEGNRCAKYLAKECPGGSCQYQQAKSPKMICPEGYTSTSGARCVATEVVPVAYTCNVGELSADFGKCVQYHSKECAGGSCEITATSSVKYKCAEGYTPKKKSFKSGTMCEIIETIPSEPVCRHEETLLDSDRCATYVGKECPNGNCELVMKSSATYHCPDGYYRSSSKTCVAMEYSSYDMFCNAGQLVEDGCRCAEYVPKICPPGGCEVTQNIEPLYDCPSGYNSMQTSSGLKCQMIDVVDLQYDCVTGASDCNMCAVFHQPKKTCPSQIAKYEGSGKCFFEKFHIPLIQ